jgi:hypothetical protein
MNNETLTEFKLQGKAPAVWCVCTYPKVTERAKRGDKCAICDLPWKPSGHGPEPIKAKKMPGRNDPCNCGSMKKFKHCCWKMHVHYGNVRRGVQQARHDLLMLDQMNPEDVEKYFPNEKARIKAWMEEVKPWLEANRRFE